MSFDQTELHLRSRCTMVRNASGRRDGVRVLIVISDLRRALRIFRREVQGKSFLVADHDDLQFGVRWWTHLQWAKTCVDVWLRLLWWMAVERWRRAEPLPRAERDEIDRMSFPLKSSFPAAKGIDGK